MQEPNLNKVTFLEEEIKKRLDSFESKRTANRKNAFTYKIVTALCSAVIVVVLGVHSLDETSRTILKDIALIISAFLTVFSTWDAFYNHRDLWIKYTGTANDLKELQSDLKFLKAGNPKNIESSKVEELYTEYKKILREANSNWEKIQSKKNNNKTK